MSEQEKVENTSFQREISLAVRNAAKLMASFVVTFGVAFVVRFWIPRFLGPEDFGRLHFSEQFAMTLFFIVTFGTDVYIRKEVAQRPDHASDFFGGLLLFRLCLSALVGVIIAVALSQMNKEPIVWRLVYTFSLGQMLFVFNTTLGAVLEARGTISALAMVNAVVKVLWGIGCAGGLLMGMGPMAIAVSFLIGEMLKVPVLYSAARRNVGLRMEFHMAGFKAIIIASLPYCLNYVALGIYSKIGVTVLSALTNDKEVGWFGAATNITFIIFLFIPILRSILMPMGARLAKESTDMVNKTLLATTRIMLMVTVPIAVMLSLNASFIIEKIYTDSFLPASASLRIISPLVPISFLCTISGVYLIQVGNIWRVARISIIALLFNIGLNAILIAPIHRYFGDGGGGIATAIAVVITESLVVTLYFLIIRKRILTGGRPIAWLVFRLILSCGVLTGIHQFIGGKGFITIFIEILAYIIIGLIAGVLPINELKKAISSLSSRSKL